MNKFVVIVNSYCDGIFMFFFLLLKIKEEVWIKIIENKLKYGRGIG